MDEFAAPAVDEGADAAQAITSERRSRGDGDVDTTPLAQRR